MLTETERKFVDEHFVVIHVTFPERPKTETDRTDEAGTAS